MITINENKDLNDLIKQIHDLAKEKGWWDSERSFGEIIALCHSELSEALEEDRKGKPNVYFIDDEGKENSEIEEWNGQKLEGVATELADCVIRIFDYCGKNNIDIAKIIEYKHEYNKKRPYKHGKKY